MVLLVCAATLGVLAIKQQRIYCICHMGVGNLYDLQRLLLTVLSKVKNSKAVHHVRQAASDMKVYRLLGVQEVLLSGCTSLVSSVEGPGDLLNASFLLGQQHVLTRLQGD